MTNTPYNNMTELQCRRVLQAQKTLDKMKLVTPEAAVRDLNDLIGLSAELVRLAATDSEMAKTTMYLAILNEAPNNTSKFIQWTILLAVGGCQDTLKLLTMQLPLSDPDRVTLWQKYAFTKEDK